MTTEDNKRRNGLILVWVAVALVLLAGGVGGYLLTSGGSDEPRTAAQEFTELFERGLNSSGRDVDASEFEGVVCGENMQQLREAFAATENPVEGAPRFELSVKDVRTDGDKGSFTVVSQITAPGAGNESVDETFGLVRQDGAWRVCGLGR